MLSSAEVSTKTTRGPLSIGTRVNQFEIRSILGEGGTAVVYEAVHTKLNAPVALKVVNMAGPYGPNAAARLRREAELCAAVDSYVPKVYDLGTLPDGTPYLVMEKVVGPTLENLLSRGRLGLRLGTLVLRDLLRAAEAVQRAGVVHRDIKPANIIVQFAADRTPSVRLMDFGVSRSLFFRRGSSIALTRRGTILGTPEYMAPEQIQDQPIDVRTDVYALGVVAYEMFAGRVPFEGEHPAEIVAAVLRREHQPLYVHRPEAPGELVALIERAMESSPVRRFKNARAMRDELEASIPRGLWAPGAPNVAPAKSPATRARRVSPKLAVMASLAFALGAGTYTSTKLMNDEGPAHPERHVPVLAAAPLPPEAKAQVTMMKPAVPTLLSVLRETSLARAQSEAQPPAAEPARDREPKGPQHRQGRQARDQDGTAESPGRDHQSAAAPERPEPPLAVPSSPETAAAALPQATEPAGALSPVPSELPANPYIE